MGQGPRGAEFHRGNRDLNHSMLLRLPDNLDRGRQGWNNTLHRMLVLSGLFEIEFKSLSAPNGNDGYFPNPRVPGARNRHWSNFELNGLLIGLDTWDTLSPTAKYEQAGLFRDYLRGVSLIIKVQHHKCPHWEGFMGRTGKPVTGWTVMPTHWFPILNPPFQWSERGHKYTACVTGKNNRFGREIWVNWAAVTGDFYTKADCTSVDPPDVYFEVLRNCRWGLVLRGKRGAEKNRREVEFTACGMPLALNYCPEYPFPMTPGVDFFYVEKPDDLVRLRETDPRPFAAASQRLFREHFSPIGMAKTLVGLAGALPRSNDGHNLP